VAAATFDWKVKSPMRKVLVMTAFLSLFAVPAMAQDGSGPQVYGSIGYAQLSGDQGDLGAVTGRLGARFNRHFGAEGEASIGVSDDELPLGIPGARAELSHDLAAYAVGYLPISPNFELFGRIGYGTTNVEVTASGSATDDSFDGVNYGVGANWFIDGSNGLRGDWTRRDFGDDGDADVWSLSYVRRF